MILLPLLATLATTTPTIPDNYQCEIVGPIVAYGDSTLIAPEAPVDSFVLSLVCPVPQISVSSTGRVSTDVEMMPVFVVLDDEQATVLLGVVAQDLADDAEDVFLP